MCDQNKLFRWWNTKRKHALHLHCLCNYWLCYENGKKELSINLFRRMQIQIKENKDVQIHKNGARIRIRVRIWCWIRGKVKVRIWFWMVVFLIFFADFGQINYFGNFEQVKNLVVTSLSVFFEGEILKCTHVLTCFIWREQFWSALLFQNAFLWEQFWSAPVLWNEFFWGSWL